MMQRLDRFVFGFLAASACMAVLLVMSGGLRSSPLLVGGAADVSELRAELRQVREEIEAVKLLLGGQPTAPTTETVVEVQVDEAVPSRGSIDAELVVVEFSDYQCPFCKRFADSVLAQLSANYVDTGRVRYVFMDFPLSIHPQAQKAAEAAHCSGDQGKYWEMHDLLFANQRALHPEDLVTYATRLGLESERFESCFSNGNYAQVVSDRMQTGLDAGLSATPSFVIGTMTASGSVRGRVVLGAQPLEVFQTVIEDALEGNQS